MTELVNQKDLNSKCNSTSKIDFENDVLQMMFDEIFFQMFGKSETLKMLNFLKYFVFFENKENEETFPFF